MHNQAIPKPGVPCRQMLNQSRACSLFAAARMHVQCSSWGRGKSDVRWCLVKIPRHNQRQKRGRHSACPKSQSCELLNQKLCDSFFAQSTLIAKDGVWSIKSYQICCRYPLSWIKHRMISSVWCSTNPLRSGCQQNIEEEGAVFLLQADAFELGLFAHANISQQ